ncbi:hypothetical protein ACFU8X_15755 [Brevibacillus porteri]|uniref:hypothetical protein n=1 Tax=Brevibacillus porteri TaxID=2126350 RepID=UPI00370ADD60
MVLNKIEVKKMTSKYCDSEHECVLIDEVPLDVIVHSLYPNHHFDGLIPTILDWIDEPREKAFVRSRYLSFKQREMLPILMCPDDCDLWCTLIIVEVVRFEGIIKWERMGIDQCTRENLINSFENIGTKVEWLEKVPSMTFQPEEYDSQISKLIRE